MMKQAIVFGPPGSETPGESDAEALAKMKAR
jgi:hypothetical protein